MTCTVLDMLRSMRCKVLHHHPPYSLDCDFHVSGCLKEVPNEDIKVEVLQWFQQQLSMFFTEGIHWLVHQWNACLNAHRDCS